MEHVLPVITALVLYSLAGILVGTVLTLSSLNRKLLNESEEQTVLLKEIRNLLKQKV